MTDYASIRATHEAATALRDLAYDLTGASRRRVSLSDTIRVACTIASKHKEETLKALSDDTGEAR
jgi:hypothetical protein